MNTPTEAVVIVDQTSKGCARYTLVADGKVIWRHRVAPDSIGMAEAQVSMEAWAAKHDVVIVESKPVQKVVQGRYGRS